MKENIYATLTWRANVVDMNKEPDRFKALVEKLLKLGLSNWPEF